MKGIGITVAMLFVFALFIGCGGSDPEPDSEKLAASAPAKAAPKPASAVKKAMQEASSIKVSKSKNVLEKGSSLYTYDPVNKPDPFKPFKAEEFTSELSSENPLLKYEVRYFKLVGVSMNETNPVAVFEDPQGRAYILSVGARIGRAGGVVQSIAKDQVVVTETRISPRFEAGTETVQIPISLHPEDAQESAQGR
jgi:Tfp pilus assembly protein PilP